jgi:hypothetical protein
MTASSKAFGSARPRRPHLALAGKGGVLGEVGLLRQQVEEGFLDIEARSSSPEIDWIDGGAIQDTGGDTIFKGRNMIQGQTFAQVVFGTGTAQLTVKALTPGTPGNAYSVEVVDGGALAIALVGTKLTVTLETGVSTAADVATAINANAADTDGIMCAVGGVGVMLAAVEAHLAGGVGEGFELRVSGEVCLPANTPGAAAVLTLTETACTVTIPDLTGLTDPRAAGDVVAASIMSDGVFSQSISCVLI